MLVRVLADGGAFSSVIAQPMSSWQRRYVTQAVPAGVGGIDRSVCTISAARRLARLLQSSTISELWYASSHAPR